MVSSLMTKEELKLKTEFTIGGMEPVENPLANKSIAHGLGDAIVAMGSRSNRDTRIKGYIELMRLRRYFTIDQWKLFENNLNRLRQKSGMCTLSQLITDISTESITGRKPDFKRKDCVMSDKLTLKLKLLSVLAIAFAAMADGLKDIVESYCGDELDVAPKKNVLNKKGSSAFGKELDEKALPPKADKKPEKSPARRKKEEIIVPDTHDTEEVNEDKTMDPATIKELRNKARTAIAAIVGVRSNMDAVRAVYAEVGVKGLNSAPDEKVPALLEGFEAALAKEKQEALLEG